MPDLTPVVESNPLVEPTETTKTSKSVPLPKVGLVLLVGISGSGKSTFAAQHFLPTQVVSSDFCRALVSDDETDQAATPDAFAVLNYIVGTRLRRGLLTVVDATNVQKSARAELVKLAKDHDVLVDAIVLDVPVKTAIERQESRLSAAHLAAPHQEKDGGTLRKVSAKVIGHQYEDLKRSLPQISKEGFRRVHILRGNEIADAKITYQKSWNDLRELSGPFDIIGDVHGCLTELCELLTKLGYVIIERAAEDSTPANQEANHTALIPVNAMHPAGRTAVFVGDLVNRGPDTPGVLRLVMNMVKSQTALCVAGNHEAKLVRALKGAKVQKTHGIEQSLAQLDQQTPEFRKQAQEFMDRLIAHYVLDDGRLIVAHAGLKESYHGRSSGRVRAFALYGDTTGESDEYGLPVRLPWAQEYRGKATVVYGHTPTSDPEWINNTICIDTGCVFGGKLTALRYPEREIVSVPARKQYYAPAKPLAPAVTARIPEVLQIDDVAGTRWLETNLAGRVKVPAENAAAALEVMSRFAVDPRWLVYLPPTMSPAPAVTGTPSDTGTRGGADAQLPNGSELAGYLERPEMAFAEYAAAGVKEVVCEEKHMGSRAVVVLARDAQAAERHFGIKAPVQLDTAQPGNTGDSGDISDARDVGQTTTPPKPSAALGAIYTRTGRAFFEGELGTELVNRAHQAMQPLFDQLNTDWLVLDCELLPWSAKALGLIKEQYAAVGAAAHAVFPAAAALLDQAASRGLDVTDLASRIQHRQQNAEAYRAAYAAYVKPTDGLDGITLAPFQILAGEGEVYALTRSHRWQLDQIARLKDPFITQTKHIFVDLADDAQRAKAVEWWLDLTAKGGEGMVVKPVLPIAELVAHNTANKKPQIQPGLKVRGREYLRIIYGPDYLDNLAELRKRNLGRKKNLAWREYALGLAALTKFVGADPLWQIHQLVFGVLALESEAIDPRL